MSTTAIAVFASREAPPTCLFENPYRLASLWDMFRVGAAWFIGVEECFAKILDRLNRVEPRELNVVLNNSDLAWIWDNLLFYFGATMVVGIGPAAIPVTMQVLKDIEFLFKSDMPTWLDMRNSITSLKTCYEAEMKAMVFLGVSDAERYEHPTYGWTEVIERFGCGDDIEEANKCLVLERHTASVFHLMKVVERGVLELQIFLEGAEDAKAHFGGVLHKLEEMVQKTKYEHIPPYLSPYVPFMREILPHLHSVKDSWRDKVTHVDNKIIPIGQFNAEKATEVYNATLPLMRRLATGLPRKEE